MKLKIKSAFSLAELLIVIGIISVLAVMLLSISKKSITNAYNLYYYTGYKAIADAISYSNTKTNNSALNAGRVCEAFGFTPTQCSLANIPVKNGISYKLTDETTRYKIEMSIPSQNGAVAVIFYYLPNVANGIVVPYTATLPTGTSLNLYDRKDLLPFYVDDGVKGRTLQTYYNNGTHDVIDVPTPAMQNANTEWKWANNKRTFSSFKMAYCSQPAVQQNAGIDALVGACASAGTKVGVIRPINPRKVF